MLLIFSNGALFSMLLKGRERHFDLSSVPSVIWARNALGQHKVILGVYRTLSPNPGHFQPVGRPWYAADPEGGGGPLPRRPGGVHVHPGGVPAGDGDGQGGEWLAGVSVLSRLPL